MANERERESEGERERERERDHQPAEDKLEEAEHAEKAPQDNSAAARRVLKLQTRQSLLGIYNNDSHNSTKHDHGAGMCVYFLFF